MFAFAIMAFGAVAWACVPQEGSGTIVNLEKEGDSAGAGTMTDLVVGDGVDATQHSQSWCLDHPSSAVWAEPGDELKFNIGKALAGQSDTSGCPAPGNESQLGSNEFVDINLVDGDAYVWNGDYWDFDLGGENGCYAPGQTATRIGDIKLDSDGYSIDGQDTETIPNPAPSRNDTFSGPRESNDIGDQASLLCVGSALGDSNPTALFFPLVLLDSNGETGTPATI